LIYTWDEILKRLEEGVKESHQDLQAYQACRAALEAFERAEARDLTSVEYAIFICCFSELKDSLNQWTLYADNGSGMALGFDVEKIKAIHVPYYQQAN